MREIGSEFWIEQKNSVQNSNSFKELINFGDDRKLLLSGRTAIDYVLEDISKPIKSVYMPSYCCTSMLQPFIDRNINVEFYEVIPDGKGIKYYIDYDKNIDVFFASSYFGYHDTNMDGIIDKFKSKNIIVIEDITHRLLCDKNHCGIADYNIASLRKWFAIPSGGLAVKQFGKFTDVPLLPPPINIIEMKIKAMKKKAIFMDPHSDYNIDKSEFMKLYSEFNKNIQYNYKRLYIDDLSREMLDKIDISMVKKKRRNNVNYIYENLKTSKDLDFLIYDYDNNLDCLLFVPLLVNEKLRGNLKQYLVSNSIFTPVHWPLPELPQLKKYNVEIYDKELSLVCDQRYDLSDMERIVRTIGEFKNIL